MADECTLGLSDAEQGAASLVGGYILTGGTSRRMGRDKARLPWRSITLVQWIATQVHEAVGNATLVGGPERYSDLGIPAIGETYPGCGPLSAIEAALRHSPFDLNLVVACDMPLLESPALRELTAAALVAGADVCAAVNAAGGLEPLCAVYDHRILPAILRALVQGRFRVRDLLAQLTVNTWRASDPRMVTNANCPSDWDTLLRSGD
jgi:molybdopterin-guanine dinucleotide biosynthesis protein A